MKTLYSTFKLVFLLSSVLFFSNCKNNSGKIDNANYIINNSNFFKVPDSMTVYRPFKEEYLNKEDHTNAPLKIYSFIDVSCASCLGRINQWKRIEKELLEYKIPIILICQSKDNYELFKFLNEKETATKFSFPFYFDRKDQFFILNDYLNPSKNNHTVLVGKNNEIILTGDITLSNEIKQVYLKTIKANLKL